MADTKRTNKTITLGSGNLYIVDYSPETIKSIIEDPSSTCSDENRLGYIKGGASLKYEAEWYTAKDDLGAVQKTIITAETASLSSGIITWNANTLQKLTATGRVTEDKSSGKRTIKIGGLANFNDKSYALVFTHTAADGNVTVIVRGQNQSSVEFSFKLDEETTINCEFACLSQDDEGTLITLIEEIDKQ